MTRACQIRVGCHPLNMSAPLMDTIGMMALGRQLTIGSLYNYITDAVSPDVCFWDKDDVARLSVTEMETRKTVQILEMASEENEENVTTEKEECWLTNLGIDDHLAMSLTAGLVRPVGAWEYAADRTSSSVVAGRHVVVQCSSFSKKISLDPTGQLEIICRPEEVLESGATHVVVAVSYGLEAFCVFRRKKEDDEKVKDLAQDFANGLFNGLKLDQDQLVQPTECILYSDLSRIENKPSWTLKPVTEQYETCKVVMDHPEDKAVPLQVWLFPLNQLALPDIPQTPKCTDISRHLLRRCRMMLDRWRRFSTDILTDPAVHSTTKDLRNRLETFLDVVLRALSGWTVSVRLNSDLKEETMLEMIEAIEIESPFAIEDLNYWLINYRRQVETLEKLAQLPGVQLVSGENLQLEIERVGKNFVVVVLHLPDFSRQSGRLVEEMGRYIDAFDPSCPSSWMEWEKSKELSISPSISSESVRASQEFSYWVAGHNSDSVNIRYIISLDGQQLAPSIRLYRGGSGQILCSDFEIPFKGPGQVVVEENFRGVVKLTWEMKETAGLSGYLLQYRSIDDDDSWNSVQHLTNTVEIGHLQPDETYVFRVATLTLGGKSPFGPVSQQITIDPVCPAPNDIECLYVTDTSITLSWAHDGLDGQMSCYSIDCWADDNEDSFIQRSTVNRTITLAPLVPDTLYCVEVRAICTDDDGSRFYSPAGSILETRTLTEPERAADVVRRVSKKSGSVGPGIDAYNLPLKKHRGTATPGVGHYVFGEPSYAALAGKRRQRTILMLGATGSGKSTLINALVNYVLGVEWEDDFRFKLIDEPAEKSQAHSQTDLVTTYDLYEMKGSRLGYSLTVVDTPGFGDTRGLEKDKQIMEQLQSYFQSRHGIQQLEAVCFVVQASLPRLTATQQYIFDTILSIFGNNIHNNIRLMVTFADNALPPVLGAVKEAGIPSPTDPSTSLPLHHKFNNSIFFTSNKGNRQTNEFNRTYFDMAVEGFDRFFDDLSRMEATSLTLTRQVLEERKTLEALVEGLQLRTEMKLIGVNELEQIKKILTENRDLMEASTEFEFEALVPKSTDISGTGQFTTNCQNCKTTCHFPCRQASDEDKHKCSVMDPNGCCMICNCSWRNHFNQRYRYEMVKEKVKKSSDAIRQQYRGAANEVLTKEQLLKRIEKEIEKHETRLVELMQATYPRIRRLNEIALKPHPFSTPDYIDLMVAAEKQEHRPGYQQRIVTLQKLRKMAEITAKLIQTVV